MPRSRGWRRLGLLTHRVAPLFEKSIDCPVPVLDGLAQLPPAPHSGVDDLPQRNSLAGQFLTYSPANETVFVKNADFRHVARIVANHHVLSDIGREREINVAQ